MSKSLLLIDDKEDFKDSFQTLAQQKGYKLAWGKSLEDLKSMMPSLYRKITAVVLDIKCLLDNEQPIEREDFIVKALLFLDSEYKNLPRAILTGDEHAFDFSRFSGDETVFKKDPEDIEKLFQKIQEFQEKYEERLKTDDEREFYKIIEQSENNKLEFKSSLQYCTKENKENKGLRFEVLKTLAAFANTDGGTLLIGVNDDREVYGLENGDFDTLEGDNKADAYKLLLDNLIESNFGNAFHNIIESVKFYTIKDKTVCKIIVKSKYLTPVYITKRVPNKRPYKAFFIRAQASSRELNNEEQEKYIKLNWSNRQMNFTISANCIK